MRGLILASLAATALIGATLAAGPARSLAQRSPSIAPSRIAVDEPLGQGEEVRLPSLSILNPTNETAAFVVDVTHSADQPEFAADATWFTLQPESFELAPGAGQIVDVLLSIPREAEVGDYRVLLRAKAKPPESGAPGVVISVAVATTLTFTVENRNFHFYDPVTDFFSDRAPFSYIGVGLLAALLAVWLLQRRFRFRFSVGVDRRE